MVGLVFYPLLATTWDSLHRVDPLQQGTPFVGLANYTRMFSDAEVGRSWFNTFVYVFLAVVFETVFGVLAAALINQVKAWAAMGFGRRGIAVGAARRRQRRDLGMDLCARTGAC